MCSVLSLLSRWKAIFERQMPFVDGLHENFWSEDFKVEVAAYMWYVNTISAWRRWRTIVNYYRYCLIWYVCIYENITVANWAAIVQQIHRSLEWTPRPYKSIFHTSCRIRHYTRYCWKVLHARRTWFWRTLKTAMGNCDASSFVHRTPSLTNRYRKRHIFTQSLISLSTPPQGQVLLTMSYARQ